MQTRAQFDEAKAFANIFAGASDRYGIFKGGNDYDSIKKPRWSLITLGFTSITSGISVCINSMV